VNDDYGVFTRERSAGLYRLSAYFLAVMTTEIPIAIILPTIYVCINYWMVNLTPDAVSFIAHWLIIVLSTFTAQSVGMLVSVVITSRPFVMSFTNTFMIGTLLAGGYYNTHVASWFRWIRYISYMTYSLNALAKMEFVYGELFECNPVDTRFPKECYGNNTQINGELFLDDWDLNFTPLYADIVALFVMIILCRVIAYVVLRYLRRPKT
jgi:hypothetical protein